VCEYDCVCPYTGCNAGNQLRGSAVSGLTSWEGKAIVGVFPSTGIRAVRVSRVSWDTLRPKAGIPCGRRPPGDPRVSEAEGRPGIPGIRGRRPRACLRVSEAEGRPGIPGIRGRRPRDYPRIFEAEGRMHTWVSQRTVAEGHCGLYVGCTKASSARDRCTTSTTLQTSCMSIRILLLYLIYCMYTLIVVTSKRVTTEIMCPDSRDESHRSVWLQ
jgi:hypothetical protein